MEDENKILTERVRELEEHMRFFEAHFNISPHKPEVMFPNIVAVEAENNIDVD